MKKKILIVGSVLLIMAILIWILAAGGEPPTPDTDNQKTERVAGISQSTADADNTGLLKPGSIVPMPERKISPAPGPEKKTGKKESEKNKLARKTGDGNRDKRYKRTIMINGKQVEISGSGKSVMIDPSGKVDKYYANLTERLGLSEKQADAVRRIFDGRQSRRREITQEVWRKSRELSRERRARIRELRRDGFEITEADLEPYRFDYREERKRLIGELDYEIEGELAQAMTQDQYDKFRYDEELKKGPPDTGIVIRQ
ncbi:MAG: hypothetical protein E3J72_20535 [Planctomycetota bacterium]|nr:MAG: hypothetical protein E3J72_20535 [Planctomycetota bacterium]